MVDDPFVEAINAFDHFFLDGKPLRLMKKGYHLNCCNATTLAANNAPFDFVCCKKVFWDYRDCSPVS